ncbi:carboxysome shell protein [Thiosulfatimonas sediminis]|uniref:Carboxysome shell protein n=1 Tax=Thiosulfatimonas sediminis TaxID=2675054 RepID=A0A6F8PY69_9GAMM|nr:CsoS2 family carboxysome shell protein [Thiosulfatimonas sediminis]BBP47069.1 carboxysome shell protein [Thiosulfatimonas sediminis]
MSQSQSGRAAAQARRQAQLGGASTSPTKTSASQRHTAPAPAPIPSRAQQRTVSAAPVAPSAAKVAPMSAPQERAQLGRPVVVAEGREAAQKRRQAQLRGNRGYQKQASNNLHPKAKAYQNRVAAQSAPKQTEAPAPKVEAAPKNLTSTRGNPSGRREVKAAPAVAVNANPGRGMSRAHRKARTLGKIAETAYKSKGSQAGAVARMYNPEASSRDIARTVRVDRCTRGKTCGTASSSTHRGRKGRNSAPGKVGFSTTLAGQGISGTQVGQGSMTGAEFGACQVVSGTEYFSSEEFNTYCESVPTAGKPKVTRTQTTHGEAVSGTAVGNAAAVTGDRAGACSVITGTEYLPADQSELFCNVKSSEPKKATGFSVNATQMNDQGASKVTGMDSYRSQSTTIRPNEPSAPRKVMASHTAAGNYTTGTQVGRIEDVTGDERGYCQTVSGTGYQGVEETETFCGTQQPEVMPYQITVSSTSRGQSISGDRSGSTTGMTGAEAGSCKAITGTPYMSFEHISSCGMEARAEIQQRTMGSVMLGKHPMTGAKPGPEGLTGAQIGACKLVTGTPYQGAGQTAAVCGGQANAARPGESDFPQLMRSNVPAAPVNAPQMMRQAAPVVMQTPVVAPPQEAPQQGSRITGDGWDRSSKVTGTEGEWATKRNPSYRGGNSKPAQVMGAHNYRPQAMPEVPQSVITGSAGNTDTGAKVTLSGGARA